MVLGDLERVQDLLNKALEADVDDNGYVCTADFFSTSSDRFKIFRISMYFETGHQAIGDKYRSNHNRLAFYDGVVNIRDVVESQIYPDREAAQEFLSPDSLKYKRGRVLVAGQSISRRTIPRELTEGSLCQSNCSG